MSKFQSSWKWIRKSGAGQKPIRETMANRKWNKHILQEYEFHQINRSMAPSLAMEAMVLHPQPLIWRKNTKGFQPYHDLPLMRLKQRFVSKNPMYNQLWLEMDSSDKEYYKSPINRFVLRQAELMKQQGLSEKAAYERTWSDMKEKDEMRVQERLLAMEQGAQSGYHIHQSLNRELLDKYEPDAFQHARITENKQSSKRLHYLMDILDNKLHRGDSSMLHMAEYPQGLCKTELLHLLKCKPEYLNYIDLDHILPSLRDQ